MTPPSSSPGTPSPGPGTSSPGPGAPPHSPVAGFVRSFSFAGQGVWHVLRTQRNMRVHLAAAIAVVIAGVVLRISAAGWAAVALAIGLVLVAEIFNTVVEAIIDLQTSEYHPLAKVAKDSAAGAVLVASIAAVGVAVAVFLPRLLH
ncbi:MAG TPA: diacylglycerol kinase family protein [Streptosporangiaceae bacterium]